MRPLKIAFAFIFYFCFIFGIAQTTETDSITAEGNKIISEQEEQITSQMAPVILSGDTLFHLYHSVNEYPVAYRADQISNRLESLSKNYEKGVDTIYSKGNGAYTSVMYNDELAFIITENDASNQNLSLEVLADYQIKKLKDALEEDEKYHLTTQEWMIRIGYFLASLIVLIIVIKLINWMFRKLNVHLSKFEKKFLKKKQNILRYFIPKSTTNIFVFISNITRFTIIVILLFTYLPFMFSFFPWTEDIVTLFYGYIAEPVKFVVYGFIDYLPNMIFIIVILIITRYVIRVQRDIVEDIEAEKFIIKGFPKDWAATTQKIISLLIWAFALVLIYPYLPGSASPAFRGVSIFIGALISFGSTTAIANIVAGVVITYMRPYQIGDRVKIQNTIGDVVEKTLLVTRIRTIKNEDVTIPNANIINNHLINYSANAEKEGLILHTSVTIGYDVPWKKVEELLIEAALKSQFIKKEPAPFVLQTSLDDNYVAYEINAHSKEAKKMASIYSDMHRNILDVFNKAEIEILSPQYIAARDGNLTTVQSEGHNETRSPLDKIVDHLTGQNQAIKVRKNTPNKGGSDHKKGSDPDLFTS